MAIYAMVNDPAKIIKLASRYFHFVGIGL